MLASPSAAGCRMRMARMRMRMAGVGTSSYSRRSLLCSIFSRARVSCALRRATCCSSSALLLVLLFSILTKPLD